LRPLPRYPMNVSEHSALSLYTAVLPASRFLERVRDEPKFFELCRACKRFGQSWSCPPYGFNAGEKLAAFEWVHLAGLKAVPCAQARARTRADEPSRKHYAHAFFEGLRPPFDDALLTLEAAYAPALSLHAGACVLCPREACARMEGKPCIHPDRMRLSLESCGCDVSRTAEEFLGLPLVWMKDELPPYFFLVGALFAQAEIPRFEALLRRSLLGV